MLFTQKINNSEENKTVLLINLIIASKSLLRLQFFKPRFHSRASGRNFGNGRSHQGRKEKRCFAVFLDEKKEADDCVYSSNFQNKELFFRGLIEKFNLKSIEN